MVGENECFEKTIKLGFIYASMQNWWTDNEQTDGHNLFYYIDYIINYITL